jgi:sugar phosphate permease
MVATLGSALSLPWVGKLVDRVTPACVTLIVIPLLCLGMIGMALSTQIFLLVLVIYLLRLFGQGMMTQNALTATARWFSASRGRAVSLVVIGHNAGEAILPLLFVMIIGWVGWRESWLVAAALLLLFALPVIVGLIKKQREPSAQDMVPVHNLVRDYTRKDVMRDPLFWLALLGMLAPAFIGTTIFFHQVYLVELRAWSLPAFASAFTIMAVCKIIFGLLAGGLVDRFSAVKLLPSFLIPLALSCFVLAIFNAQWSAFVFMGLLGTAYGFSSTLSGTIWPELYGTKYLGEIRAIIVSMMVFCTAAGPGLTGALIDKGVSYDNQIFAMGIYSLIACGVMVYLSQAFERRQGRLKV